MILLTKLDRSKVLVNLANVKYAEATPDTVLFFVNGDSLIVTESLAAIERQAIEWQARILVAADSPAALPAALPDAPRAGAGGAEAII